jgi:hypothetical protein
MVSTTWYATLVLFSGKHTFVPQDLVEHVVCCSNPQFQSKANIEHWRRSSPYIPLQQQIYVARRGKFKSRKMKVVYFSNEFQFDELPNLFRDIHQRSKSRHHPILAQFLQNGAIAVRDEVRQLPTELRRLVPTFETILAFLDFTELRKGPLSGSVDGILLCIAELGTLIT